MTNSGYSLILARESGAVLCSVGPPYPEQVQDKAGLGYHELSDEHI